VAIVLPLKKVNFYGMVSKAFANFTGDFQGIPAFISGIAPHPNFEP
jgi:hypothetical protein